MSFSTLSLSLLGFIGTTAVAGGAYGVYNVATSGVSESLEERADRLFKTIDGKIKDFLERYKDMGEISEEWKEILKEFLNEDEEDKFKKINIDAKTKLLEKFQGDEKEKVKKEIEDIFSDVWGFVELLSDLEEEGDNDKQQEYKNKIENIPSLSQESQKV